MSIDKAELSRRKSAIDKQSDSICNQTVDIPRVRVSKSRFFFFSFGVVSDHAFVSFLFQRTPKKS